MLTIVVLRSQVIYTRGLRQCLRTDWYFGASAENTDWGPPEMMMAEYFRSSSVYVVNEAYCLYRSRLVISMLLRDGGTTIWSLRDKVLRAVGNNYQSEYWGAGSPTERSFLGLFYQLPCVRMCIFHGQPNAQSESWVLPRQVRENPMIGVLMKSTTARCSVVVKQFTFPYCAPQSRIATRSTFVISVRWCASMNDRVE